MHWFEYVDSNKHGIVLAKSTGDTPGGFLMVEIAHTAAPIAVSYSNWEVPEVERVQPVRLHCPRRARARGTSQRSLGKRSRCRDSARAWHLVHCACTRIELPRPPRQHCELP